MTNKKGTNERKYISAAQHMIIFTDFSLFTCDRLETSCFGVNETKSLVEPLIDIM